MGPYSGMKYHKMQQYYGHAEICLCVVSWKVSSSVQGFPPGCAVGLGLSHPAFESLLYRKGVNRQIHTFDIDSRCWLL